MKHLMFPVFQFFLFCSLCFFQTGNTEEQRLVDVYMCLSCIGLSSLLAPNCLSNKCIHMNLSLCLRLCVQSGDVSHKSGVMVV